MTRYICKTNEEIHLSFDDQELYGYEFDLKGYKNKIKELGLKEKEDKKVVYKEFCKEQESRLYLGVHYPSDNDIAMKISQIILNNPEFMNKYDL